MKQVLDHFAKVDEVLHGAASGFGVDEIVVADESEYFSRLCRAIVGQQLSTKAAGAITKKLLKLFSGELRPKLIREIEDEKLREAGLSWAKVKYVKDLARHVEENLLELDQLGGLENELVIEELVAVKGIGRWTAEMFLMFTLGRTDVFSVGDLGLRRAMERLYGFEPTEYEIYERIAKKWSPYRTYACQVLWKSLDNNPEWM